MVWLEFICHYLRSGLWLSLADLCQYRCWFPHNWYHDAYGRTQSWFEPHTNHTRCLPASRISAHLVRLTSVLGLWLAHGGWGRNCLWCGWLEWWTWLVYQQCPLLPQSPCYLCSSGYHLATGYSPGYALPVDRTTNHCEMGYEAGSLTFNRYSSAYIFNNKRS